MTSKQLLRLVATMIALLTLAALMTSLSFGQAMPVDFRQTAGGAQAGGILHFEYAWNSSTGNLNDLMACQVGERVDYPGNGPAFTFPSLPYVANCRINNPTILWIAGQRGAFQDNHGRCDFLAPYQANQFTATQAYRWRCTNINNNQITDFAGWNNIAIVRTVANTMRMVNDPCWFYTITKSGLEAQVRPLPNAGPCPGANNPGGAGQSPAESGSSGATVSFALANPDLGLHEPVVVQFEVQNQSAEPLSLDLGLNRVANFVVSVTDPHGVITTTQLSSEGFGGSGETSVEPGAEYSQTLLLNRWNAFAAEGDYKIAITLQGEVFNQQGEVVADHPSSEVYLHIGARNAQQLAQICAGLADTAISAPNMQERMDAAQTLSYVDDAIAVPQLERVLNQGTFVQQYAVEGLGRIATPEAISALWQAVGHTDPDVRSMIWYTLNQISLPAETSPKALD